MDSNLDRATAVERTVEMLSNASVVLTNEEREEIEVVDYGFDDLETVGTEIVVYVNDERYCAKELVLFPDQTCPEHRHPPIEELDYPGKQETFRCRWGTVYLYVEADDDSEAVAPDERAVDPPMREEYYTANREVVLRPGEQFTIPPDTKHWFRAGEEGAVISEFSSMSVDEEDVFTDPEVDRMATY